MALWLIITATISEENRGVKAVWNSEFITARMANTNIKSKHATLSVPAKKSEASSAVRAVSTSAT